MCLLLRQLKSIVTFNICSDLSLSSGQTKSHCMIWQYDSDLPHAVIKSQSESVWTFLWGKGGQGTWDSDISWITTQSTSLPTLIRPRDLLWRSFSFHIKPVLNGIDGSVSTLARQREIGTGVVVKTQRSCANNSTFLSHFDWGYWFSFEV